MSLLTNVPKNALGALRRLAPPARGWIGVDLGSQSIKLAQLQRRGAEWRLAGRWLVAADPAAPLTRDAVEGGALAEKKPELAPLRRLFSGLDCAAALSMSWIAMRSMALPPGTRDELRSMVREELAAEDERGAADFTFDFWEAPDPDEDATQVTALAAPAAIAERVGGDLLRAGYRCRVLDGLPCVLARAAALAEGASEQPTAVLDLGASSWTLVIAQQGSPCFTRVLRGGGMRSILRVMAEALELPQEQCAHLLRRYGAPGAAPSGQAAEEVVARLVAGPLDELGGELERTLAYVARQFPRLKPARLWLVGGGAAMRNLPARLTQRLRLPAFAWKLPAASADEARGEAAFAAAAALSALKWEARPCS